MCKELEDELENSRRAAVELAEHLERMGAEKAKIPIQTDSGCYVIEIRKML